MTRMSALPPYTVRRHAGISVRKGFIVNSQWRTAGVVSLGLSLALVAACGSTSQGQGSNQGDTGAPSWEQQVLADAPVAKPSDIPSGTVLAAAQKRGTLIYGGGKTGSLFDVQNPLTGREEGFDATMARLLAKYVTGHPAVQEKIVTSETRTSLLNDGSVDVVFLTFTISAEREKQVDFAGPYFVSGQSIIVRDSNNDIHGLADLKGRTVCVTKGGDAFVTMQDKVPSAKLVTVDSSAPCETALREGRVDAEVQDNAIELGQASKGGLKIVGPLLTQSPYGIGLANNSPEVTKFLDDWLRQIIKDGTWMTVYQNTVGTVKGATPIVPTPGQYGA